MKRIFQGNIYEGSSVQDIKQYMYQIDQLNQNENREIHNRLQFDFQEKEQNPNQQQQQNRIVQSYKRPSFEYIKQKPQKIYPISKPHILIKDTNNISLQQKEHILDQHLCRIFTKILYSDNQYQAQQQILSLKCQTDNQRFQEVIYIGRMGIYPVNYIYIDSHVVSRDHCKIRKVNSDMQPLCKNFITFLGCRMFCDEYHPLYGLQKGIIKKILEYAANPHGYYLVDIESRNGTYVKLKQQFLMKINDIFTFGEAYELHIESFFQASSILEVHQHNQLFFQSIFEYQQKLPLLKLIGKFDLENPNQKYYWLKIYLKYEDTQIDYLISSSLKVVKIGLNQDININDPSISYSDQQCRIIFNKQNWYICDGGSSPSIHGTWKKLRPYQQYKLSNQEIIKVASSNFLQFFIMQQQILKKQMSKEINS